MLTITQLLCSPSKHYSNSHPHSHSHMFISQLQLYIILHQFKLGKKFKFLITNYLSFEI